MQDEVFETFRRLVKERNPELMKILNVDREPLIPVRMRPSTTRSTSKIPGVIQMVTVSRDFAEVQVGISEKLGILLSSEDANKSQILKELSDEIGWEGIAQLFQCLLKNTGAVDDVVMADLEKHSAGKPQYGIKVVPYGCYQSGKGGYFEVVMYDCEDETNNTPIDFETQIQKVLYVWFLLHPRQKMTLDDFEKLIREKDDHFADFAESMYKMGGKFAQRYLVHQDDTGRQRFTKEFNSLKSNIANHIMIAWKKIGGRGILDWYTIQSVGKREANENSMSYFINLFPENIIFQPCPVMGYGRLSGTIDLENCRMPDGKFPLVEKEDELRD